MHRAPSIVWFRDDLRLADNPALVAAAAAGPVLALFVLEEPTAERPVGAAARWWLHQSLHALGRSLARRKVQLVLRRGDPCRIVPQLASELGAACVYWNRRYLPEQTAGDAIIKEQLVADGREARSFNGSLLHEPWELRTSSGDYYKVFTPYWNACLKRAATAAIPAPLAVPRLSAFAQDVASDDLDAWSLTPHAPDWAAAFADTWTPGEDGAMQAFERFIMQQRVDTYEADRDRPGVEGTSRLSPHLRSGEISPRQLWAAIHEHPARDGAAKFLAEVGWREFCYHLLFHVNDLTTTNFRADFARMPWLYDRAVLRAWQRGRTGYPLVDAGMRQLWQTGWMHNRVRMVVASFLTKHLLHDWRHGEAWFWDTLVDADRANNVCGWQWVAGCGADAAPYFRVFNPTAQSTRFDPQGVYLRRWLPELAALPDRWIHEPSSAPAGVLREAGVVPGTTYPRPIVEHGAARQRALDAWATIRG